MWDSVFEGIVEVFSKIYHAYKDVSDRSIVKDSEYDRKSRRIAIWGCFLVILILVAIVGFAWYLLVN